jgi:hypothetical protein
MIIMIKLRAWNNARINPVNINIFFYNGIEFILFFFFFLVQQIQIYMVFASICHMVCTKPYILELELNE